MSRNNHYTMEIKQYDDGRKGLFYIELDNKKVAEMTYVWAGTDRIIIDHTGVGDILRGKSAGKQLVAASVKFAREKGIKILPLCPFAKSVFEKVTEYQDVL
ncbi:MAG: GNAT family N-acetyltransferase [Bacteroidia bacterium]